MNTVKEKSCKTCWGFGMHALGEACPMGPMDASDGMPTVACPECGADANPRQAKEMPSTTRVFSDEEKNRAAKKFDKFLVAYLNLYLKETDKHKHLEVAEGPNMEHTEEIDA
jgi:hypothetical protein